MSAHDGARGRAKISRQTMCRRDAPKHRPARAAQKRNDERDSRRRTLAAKRERAKPERASDDENTNSGARKIQDDRGNRQGERNAPKDPAFSSLTKIILAAGQNHDRGQTKKISGLVAIRKRPEIAFIVPKWRTAVPEPKKNRDSSENDDAGGKQTKLESRFTQFELLGTDDVEPAQAGDETQ